MIITGATLDNIRFGLLFRKIALNEMDIDYLNDTEKKLLALNMHIKRYEVETEILSYSLRDLFFSSKSSQLLWIYRCLDTPSGNLLYDVSPYMKEISQEIRGGLNVYKRIGWDIHVLYAYQMICSNFSNNESTFVKGAPSSFSTYQVIENRMDLECRFILRLATFIHDIGVVDGVKDHEKSGIKWVEKRIDELEITETFLANKGIRLSLSDLNAIMRFIVGNHQMINQIGSEISDANVAQRVQSGANSLHGYAKAFFNNHIADIMYLLSAADLLAVNDTLLTEQKDVETRESFEYFSSIIKNGYIERDYIKYGIQRFRSLLMDSMKSSFSDGVFTKTILDIGYDPNEVAYFLYWIPQMSYAMTFVKPQYSFRVALKMFCLVLEYMKIHALDTKQTTLKFDPDIDYVGAGKYLESVAVFEALNGEHLILNYCDSDYSLNIGFRR